MNKRKKPNWGLIVIVSGLLVYFGYELVRQQIILDSLDGRRVEIEENIKKEGIKNKELLNQKAEASSDEYVEKIAREKLGMVKQGERVFVDINK